MVLSRGAVTCPGIDALHVSNSGTCSTHRSQDRLYSGHDRLSSRVTFAGVAWWRPGLVLVDVSVVEQRHQVVLAVHGGVPVVEAAARVSTLVAVGLVRPHIRDLSTSNSQPGEDGSKPCSASQRDATRLRHDHHARITSRSTSVP